MSLRRKTFAQCPAPSSFPSQEFCLPVRTQLRDTGGRGAGGRGVGVPEALGHVRGGGLWETGTVSAHGRFSGAGPSDRFLTAWAPALTGPCEGFTFNTSFQNKRGCSTQMASIFAGHDLCGDFRCCIMKTRRSQWTFLIFSRINSAIQLVGKVVS